MKQITGVEMQLHIELKINMQLEMKGPAGMFWMQRKKYGIFFNFKSSLQWKIIFNGIGYYIYLFIQTKAPYTPTNF